MKTHLYVLTLAFALYGCVPSQTETTTPAPSNPTCSSTQAEIASCAHVPVSGGVTITGKATFKKRTIVNSGGELVLEDDSVELPIRFAEVRVVNSSGQVVQCGQTDTNGDLKAANNDANPLQIPGTAGNYSIQVLSRSKKALTIAGKPAAYDINVSVKKDICTNDVHTISVTKSTTGASNITIAAGELQASARESVNAQIPGGAFNILNNVVTTYEYFGAHTGTQDLRCLNFNGDSRGVNPKLQIFWQSGFNPAQYIYADEDPADVSGVSFYLRGYNELYILGGRLGNVKTEDTDHFDDSVIIHEIGHHIEDGCGKMESPGGTHYGTFRIDPRLAWSEGWGNFLGAHIIRNNLSSINNDPGLGAELNAATGSTDWNFYLDTSGYSGTSSVGQESIRFDLSRSGADPDDFTGSYHYDEVDSTNRPGEGHFREVSIARSLFKSTNTCANCTGADNMSDMWQAFRNMATGTFFFRSSIRFYSLLSGIMAGPAFTDVTTVLTNEAQQLPVSGRFSDDSVPYGIALVRSGVLCTVEIRPKRENFTTQFVGDDELADQRFSNHFFYLDSTILATGSPATINQITVTATNTAGNATVDFDLILFNDGYRFVEETCSGSSCSKTMSSTQFALSARTPSNANSNSETMNSVILTASKAYLLNVRAYTAGRTVITSNPPTYTYTLTTNNAGEYLCPATTF